jgi:hypothetical protein
VEWVELGDRSVGVTKELKRSVKKSNRRFIDLLAIWLWGFRFDFKLHLGTVEANIEFKKEVCLTQNQWCVWSLYPCKEQFGWRKFSDLSDRRKRHCWLIAKIAR